MICPNCSSENSSDRRYCANCGHKLAVLCDTCGSENAPGVSYCGQCGTRLRAESARDQSATVVENASIATERRLVSVLFCDLVGFTSASEQRDVEVVRELLTGYFETARQTVERYGGSIEKFIGDAVMAVWGTPIAREDDAERAVRAALDLVERTHRLEPPLESRAAVTTGEAAVALGAVGQGMVAGDVVNTAARLQAGAEPGTVVVDRATVRAAEAAVAFEAVGDLLLRGRAESVAAYRAVRIVAERGGRGRSDVLEPPFVGRDAELLLLKDLFHATGQEKRARHVAIIGQGGIGKSRLAWELLKYIDGVAEPVYWHEGRCPAYGEGITFWALGEMVRRRAQLAEGDDAEKTAAAVAEVVAEFSPGDGQDAWIEQSLLGLLGQDRIPTEQTESLFAAWRGFFERIATRGTVVLLVEDLQWADSGMLDFLESIIEWSSYSPIFILTLARPELLERRDDWRLGGRRLTTIHLDALTDSQMHELVMGVAPGIPQRAADAIVERSAGMPLYAVETLRMLISEGKLQARDGRYEPVGSFPLTVPATLRALIAARLDALEPLNRALLLDASVLGLSFAVEALAAVHGGERAELEERLRDLIRRELLMREADPRSPERGQYRFVQAMTREVAYGTLARRELRSRHLAAARYFEAIGDDEIAAVLASHYLEAWRAVPDGPEAAAAKTQARTALRGAGARAASLGAHQQAASLIEQAIAIADNPTERADLLEQAAESASAAGRHDDAIVHARTALELRPAEDSDAVIRSTAGLATALIDGYRLDDAVALLEPALTSFDPAVAESASVELAAQLARAYYLRAELPRALEWIDRVLRAAERHAMVAVIADALITRGMALVLVGQQYEGIVELEGGRALAEQEGRLATVLRALHNLSSAQANQQPRAALVAAKHGLALARRLGRHNQAAHLLINATASAIRTADWDWALGEIRPTLDQDFDPADRGRLLGALVTFRVLRGEEYASEIVEFEEALAKENDPQTRAHVRAVRAEAAAARGDLSSAVAELRQIPESSAESETILEIARLLLRQEDVDGARSALARLEAAGPRGRAINVGAQTIRAGILALTGDSAAARTAYREALHDWRELELPFDAAVCVIDLLTFLGPSAVSPADIEMTRGLLDELGARPLRERLDRALSQGAHSIPGKTSPREAAPTGDLQSVSANDDAEALNDRTEAPQPGRQSSKRGRVRKRVN